MNQTNSSAPAAEDINRHNSTPDRIQILTTMNENYLPRLQVLLTSIRINQPDEEMDIWLMHSGIPMEALDPVARQCRCSPRFLPKSSWRRRLVRDFAAAQT